MTCTPCARMRQIMPALVRDPLNRHVPLITPETIIAIAESWVGVPYRHQGRSRFGVDCVGLPIEVMREAGILPGRFDARADYGRRPSWPDLRGELDRWCIRSRELVPASLIAIRWPRAEDPSHIAIYTGTHIIHAYRKQSGVVRVGYRGHWVKLTARDERGLPLAWRLPGVRYE